MKINVPTSWQGVTLREFQEVNSILSEAREKREAMTDQRKIDQFDYETECVLISTLTGESIDEIMMLSRGSHNHIMNQLSFLSEPVEGKLQKRLTANGQRYYFQTNARKINGGQWISLMHFLDDEDKVDKNLHNLLACFAQRRKWYERTGKYDGKIHNEVAADLLELPITSVKPLTDFFLSDWLSYVKSTTRFLEYAAKGLKRLAERELKRS